MFVEYKSGDLVGFIMAWCSMVPILFVVSLFTLIAVRRDLTTIFYFFGFILTELTNFVLKNLIKQPRPQLGHGRHMGSFSKHGMPSDHSQIMFYFSSFFILLVAFRYHINNGKANTNKMLHKSILIIGSFFAAVLVALSRVYLEYHTVEQVLVGAFVGTFIGCVWFYLVHSYFSQYFHMITTWKISEYLMVRDYSHIPNILLFQYSVERNESNVRRKNKMN